MLFLICGKKWWEPILCKDYLWFSSFVGEKTVGEDKNVGWEVKTVGWKFWWEDIFVGGNSCWRKKSWEQKSVGGNLPPHQIFFPTRPSSHNFFFPTKPSSHPTLSSPHHTFFSSPTLFSSHKWGEPQKILPQNRLPPHQTKKRASLNFSILTSILEKYTFSTHRKGMLIFPNFWCFRLSQSSHTSQSSGIVKLGGQQYPIGSTVGKLIVA